MNLIAAAIIGIAIIVLLIAVCKVHPFLSLLAGSFTMAVCAGVEYDKAFGSFTSGVGSTIANVGLLIAFGSPTPSSTPSWPKHRCNACRGQWH